VLAAEKAAAKAAKTDPEVSAQSGPKPHQKGVGRGVGGGRPPGGVRAASRKTGVPRTTLDRALKATEAAPEPAPPAPAAGPSDAELLCLGRAIYGYTRDQDYLALGAFLGTLDRGMRRRRPLIFEVPLLAEVPESDLAG